MIEATIPISAPVLQDAAANVDAITSLNTSDGDSSLDASNECSGCGCNGSTDDCFVAESALTRNRPGSSAVSGVVLLSANQFQLASHALHVRQTPKPSLGLQAIQIALRDRGFGNVRTYPNRSAVRPDVERNARSIVSWLRMLCGDGKGIIFGISTTSDEYYIFSALSKLLQAAFPKARIVAGGPHFVRENLAGASDTVEMALRTGLAHAVQVGHPSGFVDLVTRYNGALECVNSPGFYRLNSSTGSIVGKNGRGTLPALSSLPFVFSKNKSSCYHVVLNDTCRNGCDFCFSVRSRPVSFSADTAIAGLRLMLSGPEYTGLQLYDSNPFESDKFEYYKHIFDESDPSDKSVPKHAYIDPSHLVLYEDRARLGNFFLKHCFWEFYVGRDAVTEHGAMVIGSRVAGRIKKQAQLDLEKKGLQNFIRELKMVRAGGTPDLRPHIIVLSYILSPFETRDSALAQVDDMEEFYMMSDRNVAVKTKIFPLMPYPGTPIRKKHAAAIDLEDYSFGSLGNAMPRPWKAGSGPSRELLSHFWDDRSRSSYKKLRQMIMDELR